MGTDGTASGLSQPLIFHTGNTTDFPTKGGDTSRFNYTLTTYRTGTGEADISTSKWTTISIINKQKGETLWHGHQEQKHQPQT
jgi:hypothetical protein